MDKEKDFTIDPINYKGMKEYFEKLNIFKECTNNYYTWIQV